ncbi:hypothetical protein M3226_28710 [Neobacillus cucumis]|uniref:hypothetical protein n=1 Tax=Neobacillus cucumis TaxID=1740721 RepID=UPI0020405033|nr:hypothetical protein [Neobacillus cucumis]MCM3729568.1 hypothetical protein [Neobacillus cucumis]
MSSLKSVPRLGKNRYSAAHDFRRSAIKMQISQMEKAMRNGELTKEMLVNQNMHHVNADPKLNAPKHCTRRIAKERSFEQRLKVEDGFLFWKEIKTVMRLNTFRCSGRTLKTQERLPY